MGCISLVDVSVLRRRAPTLRLFCVSQVDKTSPFALTGAVFGKDR